LATPDRCYQRWCVSTPRKIRELLNVRASGTPVGQALFSSRLSCACLTPAGIAVGARGFQTRVRADSHHGTRGSAPITGALDG